MKNIYKKNLAPMVFVVSTVVFIGCGLIAFAEDKPAAKPGKSIKPGPRGPVGPDVPLTKAEKNRLATRVTVKGFTAETVQAACGKASTEGIPVVFLPAGKYEFNKTVNIPAGITILGSGSKTICVNRQPKGATFRISTPNARITRLRIEGPSTNRKSRGRNSGVSVSSKFAQNARIDHCEIVYCCFGAAFGGQCGGQVDHCHIHHCIVDGLGYGVIPSSGARVLMCDNDFGPCRHCIASNGALDWSSPKRVGKYIHKKGIRKTHWELVHNRFYGDKTTNYHRHWVIDTHPGMNGTFVVENNVIENIRMGLGIRDGAGIIKGNLFRNITRTAIIITWGKHNGIVVEGTMPKDIDISKNRFEKVKKQYDIRKSENVSIDGKVVPETRTERKGPKTKIPRLKPIVDVKEPETKKAKT